MEKIGWKITAIIFITLFVLQVFFMVWIYRLGVVNNELTYECYYEVCELNDDASFDSVSSLCTCYDYDNLGYLIESKHKIMNNG